MSWTVKMWHFGRDSPIEYSGKQFQITWKDSLNVFHRIYSKEYKKKRKTILKVRDEIQEYPNKPLKDALIDKLKDDGDGNGDRTFTVGL